MTATAPIPILAAALVAAGCAALARPDVAAEPAALKAGEYRLDPEHAALVFRIDHLGFSKFIGRFERFDATLDFDAADPEQARVEAVIDIASLDVANDAFARTLLGAEWFDAAAFPEARFSSTRIERTGETAGRMTGDLTLRGVTHAVTLDVAFNGGATDFLRGGYVVGFSATGAIRRGDFGVDRFDEIIGDEVEIALEAEFVRRRPRDARRLARGPARPPYSSSVRTTTAPGSTSIAVSSKRGFLSFGLTPFENAKGSFGLPRTPPRLSMPSPFAS
jgi:polyisoprenoid-binding protein YceI